MKKLGLFVAALVVLTCLTMFAGCALFHEHEPGEWITDTEATCTNTGSKHQICATCGETLQTEDIPSKDHTNGEWVVDVEPTCTEKGGRHQVCAICEETIRSVISPATGHADGEWIVDVEPTCTEEGSKHQVCSVCEETIKTETIPATGHKNGDWITDVEPTCDEDGSKHQVCSVCEETIETSTIAAKGHDFSETITKATATTKASVKFDCKVCEFSETKQYEPINVYAYLAGSGMTMTGGGMYYTRSFEVIASGGYGEYLYKFESGSGLLQDFSTSNQAEIYGNLFIDGAEITITVMDQAGQKTVYVIRGDGSYINSYVIYE